MGTEVFWVAAAAVVAFAALVASIVTIGVGALIRKRNRPEPEWEVVIRYHSQTSDSLGLHVGGNFSGSITNVGDGSAFQLRLRAKSGAEIPMWWDKTRGASVRASMLTGDDVNFHLEVGLDDWVGEVLTLTWVEAPTRIGKTRSKIIDLTEGRTKPELEFHREDIRLGAMGVITREEWESDNKRKEADRAQALKERGDR